jgi:PAS domain S-box-containing protein
METQQHEFMVTCDLEYRITSFNLAAERTFQMAVDDVIGRSMPEVICAKEFGTAAHAIFLEVKQGRFQWEGEMTSRRATGQLFQSQVRIYPIENNAGIMVGLAAVGRDLTEQQVETSERAEFARYLVQEQGKTPSTAYTYEQGLIRLERYLGKDASTMGVDDVRRFLRNSQYHPATKSSTLVAIKAFHKWGDLEGKWQANGILSLQAPKQIKIPKPALEPDEVLKVLDACRSSNDHRLVRLGLFAGCRVSDSAIITENEWKSNKLRFVGVKEKRMREVPVHEELLRKRETILSRSTSRGTLKHVARSLSHYTQIPFTTHSLRRTFMVRLLEQGVPREVIRELVGHSHPDVLTRSYASVRWSEMVSAIEALSYEESA